MYIPNDETQNFYKCKVKITSGLNITYYQTINWPNRWVLDNLYKIIHSKLKYLHILALIQHKTIIYALFEPGLQKLLSLANQQILCQLSGQTGYEPVTSRHDSKLIQPFLLDYEMRTRMEQFCFKMLFIIFCVGSSTSFYTSIEQLV